MYLYSIFALLILTGSFGVAAAVPQTGHENLNVAERRMYSLESKKAWKLVLGRIDSMGLKINKEDPNNQVFITKPQRFGSSALKWLDVPAVDNPYRPSYVEFHVFVSPFVEPARLYIGSVTQLRRLDDKRRVRLIYNLPKVNLALLQQLEDEFGQSGLPISFDLEQREKLSFALLEESNSRCSEVRLAERKSKDLVPPEKIKVTEIPIVYPAPAKKEGIQDTVSLILNVLEDGAVVALKSENERTEYQLDYAALGPLSLFRFKPAMLEGCPIPLEVVYSVQYRMQ